MGGLARGAERESPRSLPVELVGQIARGEENRKEWLYRKCEKLLKKVTQKGKRLGMAFAQACMAWLHTKSTSYCLVTAIATQLKTGSVNKVVRLKFKSG